MSFALLVVLAGCGNEAKNNNAGATLAPLSFPAEGSVQALGLNEIPAGTYKLARIRNQRLSSKKVDYRAEHRLAVPGAFSSGADRTAYAVNWKGNDRNLAKGEHYYAYEEMNVAVTLTASGTGVGLGSTHYYWNKVRTDTGYLNWLAETSRISDEGRRHIDLFLKGTADAKKLFRYDFGYSNITAKGLVYRVGDELVFVVEQSSVVSDGSTETRIIELTYKK